MTTPGKKFRKRNKDLFRGYSFSFQGFTRKDTKDYEKIVKILGAEVRADAAYTFADQTTNLMADKFYRPCYILHSMREEKALDIKEFRLYGEDTICKLCVKEFEMDLSDEINDITSNNNDKDEIINYKRIKIEPDESSNTSNLNTKGPARRPKTFKSNSNKNKSTTSNICVVEENNDVEKVLTNHQVNSKAHKIKKKKRTKINDSNSSDSEFSFSEYEKEIGNEEDEKNDTQFKRWWQPQNITKNQQCQIQSCSLEPGVHYKHRNFDRNLSLEERRVLLKYLINTHQIQAAKANSVYMEMISLGYLAHRTAETLRNCFRRRILPRIDDYNLPNDIKGKLKAL